MSDNNTIVVHKAHLPQTAVEIRAQVQTIQEVMKAVMKRDVHYGVIPGAGHKPTLLKPGAEVLLTTFRISVQPDIEDLSGPDEIRYRVKAVGVHMTTQTVVGIGIGECSSSEEKYKWRRPVCKAEYDNAPEDRRRVKYQKNGEAWTQVRQEPSDIANTVLKMAKKRAEVDLCLTALAASDVFAQDLEDTPIDVQVNEHPKANTRAPRSTRAEDPGPDDGEPAQTGTVTGRHMSMLRTKLNDAGIMERDLCKVFRVERLDDLPFTQMNPALDWIKENAQ